MFIFYFLGVGPPCPSILCQFWLCEEAQCVYLRRHLGSPQLRSLVVVLNSLCQGHLSDISLKLNVILVASFGVYMHVIHSVCT